MGTIYKKTVCMKDHKRHSPEPAQGFQALAARDRQTVWHPYSSMGHPAPVYPVASASGVRLRLADGRELIDGMSSWWCAIHGYNHPVLNAALTAQASNMAHVMFGGLTHEPAVRLAEELVRITPAGLDTVFFADSGSVAVEVAMKMAVQYWAASNRAGKQKFLTIKGGYHCPTAPNGTRLTLKASPICWGNITSRWPG
jgi:adenosylmethionine-8-amino-7-oxononanoate aminotransferase